MTSPKTRSPITTLREERQWTLRDLSWITGISLGYLSDLETGRKTNPTIDTLHKIATAFGLSVTQLMEQLEIFKRAQAEP